MTTCKDIYIDSLENRDHYMKFSCELLEEYITLAQFAGWKGTFLPYDLSETVTSRSSNDYLAKSNFVVFEGCKGSQEFLNSKFFSNAVARDEKLRGELADIGCFCDVTKLVAEDATRLASVLESAIPSIPKDEIIEKIDLEQWLQESKSWDKEKYVNQCETRFSPTKSITVSRDENGREVVLGGGYIRSYDEETDFSAADGISLDHLKRFISLLRKGSVRFVRA